MVKVTIKGDQFGVRYKVIIHREQFEAEHVEFDCRSKARVFANAYCAGWNDHAMQASKGLLTERATFVIEEKQ